MRSIRLLFGRVSLYKLDWRNIMTLLIYISWIISVIDGATQSIVEEPQDTRALSGSSAVLRCRVQNQNGPVTWAKDGFMLGVARTLPSYPRYSMIGSSAHGEYHLEIKDVQLQDDAEYQCQISATAEQPMRKSVPVKLTVLVTPAQPRLIPSIGPISTREGRNVSLTCQTNGSKPAAFISWAFVKQANGRDFVRKLYAPHESIIKNHGQLYAPQRGDDGLYIACMVEHETLTSPLVSTVQLRIQYPPKVNVTLNSTDQLLENRRAVLACNADAYPSDKLRYTWYQNQQIIQARTDRYLIIPSLNVQQHHNNIFRCHVDNDVGEGGFGEYTMKLKYKPIITSSSPAELFFNENDTVTLRCEADANPPAKIKWFKESSSHEISKDNNLTLHKLQYSDQGTYLCKAYSDDPSFEPASRQFKIFINGPPRVEIRSMIYGRKGAENFKLHCHVRSPPDSDTKIIWKRGYDELITPDDHYSTNIYKDGIANYRSVLTIRKVEPSDFGLYNCTAQNRLGPAPDSGVTHLVQAEEFPTYAILGVAGGCLAILALALALIVVNRKYLCRSKSSTNGDDSSDIGQKVEDLGITRFVVSSLPEMYSSNMNAHDQGYSKKNTYMRVPQYDQECDNHDYYPHLPPPYPYCNNGTSAMTNTTFSNGIVPSVNGMNHGYSSPTGNGRFTHATYLVDTETFSPTTTTTTVTTSLRGDQQIPNGYHLQLSPASPTISVPGPDPSTFQHHFHNQYQAYNYNVYNNVDLLNGHPMENGTVLANGTCLAPDMAMEHFGIDGSMYRPILNGYGYPQSYLNSSPPLETVHEVPTPDAVDDQYAPPQVLISDQHQIRRSSSANENVARCSSQLSTHV